MRRFGRRLILPVAVLAVTMAACVRLEPPAPVVFKGSPPPSAAKAAAPPAAARPAPAPKPGRAAGVNTVAVAKGDTLYAIARRHRVALRDLIEGNRLRPPYLLKVGQRLTLPPPREHVVAAGDTVYAISRRYGVDMTALVRLNAIAPPYTIAPGQLLRLPATTGAPVAQLALSTANPSVRAAAAPPAAGARGKSTAAATPAAKGKAEAADAKAGRTAAKSPPAAAAEGESKPAPATTATPKPKPRSAKAKAGPRGRRVALATPPPRSGRGFDWPLKGKILSSFGSKKGGLHNDGINIAARPGAAVKAAENGVVVYAGNELRGFGNLVLIKHRDGWVTAYAHNKSLLVRRGDRVRRGQVIARAGSTGNVSTPQLHFEIRRGARAVNPRKYLTAALSPEGPRPA